MRNTTEFWDSISAKYAARPVQNQSAYQYKLEYTQNLLHTKSRVLEFGCGTGSTALVHAPQVAQYEAIDISPKMIAIAQDKLQAKPIGSLNFKVATLEQYDQAAQFDAVLGMSILHLVDKLDDVINKVYKLLKPGGYFISSTTCMQDKMWFAKPIVAIMQWLGKAPPVFFLKQEALIAQMQSAGFEIEHRWSDKGSPSVLFLVARKPE